MDQEAIYFAEGNPLHNFTSYPLVSHVFKILESYLKIERLQTLCSEMFRMAEEANVIIATKPLRNF